MGGHFFKGDHFSIQMGDVFRDGNIYMTEVSTPPGVAKVARESQKQFS